MKNNDFEPVDNTPVEIPTRLRLPQSRTDQMRAFIRAELSRQAAEKGYESFEEADDVEPDDEEDMPLTPYERMLLEPIAAETAAAPAATASEAKPTPSASEPVKPEASDGPKP